MNIVLNINFSTILLPSGILTRRTLYGASLALIREKFHAYISFLIGIILEGED